MAAATTPSSMRRWLAGLCAGLVLAASAGAAAQAYPHKTVRLVVGAPTGGGTDQLARLIGERLAQRTGQPFIVDNRGAGGNIAALAVAKAAPYGNMLLDTDSQLTATTATTTHPGLDPIKQLSAVALVGWQPIVVGVGDSVPARSIRELVGLSRALPGKYAFAACGQGAPWHPSGAFFKLSAGIDLTHVPDRGCGPATVDVAEPAVAETMRGLQFEPTTASAEDFGQMLRDDPQRWTRTVRDAKIKTE